MRYTEFFDILCKKIFSVEENLFFIRRFCLGLYQCQMAQIVILILVGILLYACIWTDTLQLFVIPKLANMDPPLPPVMREFQ